MLSITDKENGSNICYQIPVNGFNHEELLLTNRVFAKRTADEHGMGDCHIDVYDSAECFVVGNSLEGADDLIAQCKQWQKERDKIFAGIAEKNKGVA